MTTEQVKNWSRLRGITEPEAMLEMRFFADIITSNKKLLRQQEQSKDSIPDFSIEQLGW